MNKPYRGVPPRLLPLLLSVLFVASSCSCDDNGTEPEPEPTSVVVSPSFATLIGIGATTPFSAQVKDQNGETMTGVTVSWMSSAPGVAEVNSLTGIVTSIAPGTATITATAVPASAQASVTVQAGIPVVTTAGIAAITGASAQGGGNVTIDNGGAVTARGVCWSTDPVPTVLDACTLDGTGTGIFSSSLFGLISGVTYYVQGYATNSAGTGYGAEFSFKTGAYVDERPGGSPLDITGSLPHYGEVSAGGYSHYRITGAIPNGIYTTILTRTDGLPVQMVPNAVSNGGIVCGWTNQIPGATIDCAMRATETGVLEFWVNGDDTVGGAYSITVAEGGIVNEGRPKNPVVVDTYPFSGGALIQSYYLLTGLTPGGAYAIQFTDAISPVALFVYPDETYQSRPDICFSRSDTRIPCQVLADGSGQIYLMTNAQQEIYGVTYTISVTVADPAN